MGWEAVSVFWVFVFSFRKTPSEKEGDVKGVENFRRRENEARDSQTIFVSYSNYNALVVNTSVRVVVICLLYSFHWKTKRKVRGINLVS